jgi:hypothetical protein
MEQKTVKELREIAKGYGITGRWNMSKEQLIKAINKVEDYIEEHSPDIPEKIQPEVNGEVTAISGKHNDISKYLDGLQPGTLVAFKYKGKGDVDRVLSGKYVETLVDLVNETIIIETKLGTKFTIPKASIIWVKTGTKWPKWVYALFEKRGV